MERSSSKEKLEKLHFCLQKHAPDRKLSIAFSGGLDSRFLSFFAKQTGYDPKLFHISGPHLGVAETDEAIKWAEKHSLSITVIEANPLQIEQVQHNLKDRCYYCKRALFSQLIGRAKPPICDGTNHSDLGDYRPGLKALSELGILSPLVHAGLTKSDIRSLGKFIGLDNVNQPSKPCMLTRFPYNQTIDLGALEIVRTLEHRLERYFREDVGFIPNFRVRQVALRHYELHVTEKDWELLSRDQKEATEAILRKNFSRHGEISVGPMPILSGFFDRQEQL